MHRRQFTGTARVLRGVVLGSALFVLTVGGHTAADHGAHDLVEALWLLPLTILLSTALTERRRSPLWLVAYLLGAQLLFHAMLAISLGHGGLAASIAPSPTMVLVHVVAALVAALALHHADALLHRWLAFTDALTRGPSLDLAVLPSWPALTTVLPPLARHANDGEPWLGLRAPPIVPA